MWIAVDFDGTLADQPAQGGAAKPRAVRRVLAYLAAGQEVRIFTNRADRETDCIAVRAFCREHFGRELPITATKDRECIRIEDDIARQAFADGTVAQ